MTHDLHPFDDLPTAREQYFILTGCLETRVKIIAANDKAVYCREVGFLKTLPWLWTIEEWNSKLKVKLK